VYIKVYGIPLMQKKEKHKFWYDYMRKRNKEIVHKYSTCYDAPSTSIWVTYLCL